MKKTLASLLLAGALSSGCANPPPATPIDFPPEEPRVPCPARDPEPTSETLAPVDRWHKELAKIVPAGWRVEEAQDQLEFPEGWERYQGGRGIEIALVNPTRTVTENGVARSPRFVVSLFPSGWEGRAPAAGVSLQGGRLVPLRTTVKDGSTPARFYGASTDWIFFHSTLGHEGWDRPEDDVARALKIVAAKS
jgi:hypothetical protein